LEPDNVEDAIDDVVDGKVGATVVDQATLEAYKLRKPGRFLRLQEVARSKPFPPSVVAYYKNTLDAAKREKFLRGLLNASGKEKGKMMLALFHLTGFAKPPADLDAVLARIRKDYPEPKTDATK
jgi:ABC-type phosphate/phosphonate transport system substrate-binding protein